MAEDENLKILKRRYAKGEITKAEYDQMKEDLNGSVTEPKISGKTSVAGKASTQAPSTMSPLVGVVVVLLVVAFVWSAATAPDLPRQVTLTAAARPRQG